MLNYYLKPRNHNISRLISSDSDRWKPEMTYIMIMTLSLCVCMALWDDICERLREIWILNLDVKQNLWSESEVFLFGYGTTSLLRIEICSCWFSPKIGNGELVQKNLADLHCTFFMQHQNKKSSSAVKKNIIGQRAFLKRNCEMSTEKYQSDYFTTDVGYWVFLSITYWNMHDAGKEMFDRCHAVMLPFLPRSVIFPGRHRLSFFCFI